MSSSSKPTILCVDDERIVIMSLKAELKSQLGDEARIEIADSGTEALAVMDELELEGSPLALVISDLKMPGMTGDILLAKVRERSPDTLNILLTGYADLDAIANAINRAGLYRYLGKPWRRDDLLLTVREALRSWRKEMLLREKTDTIEMLSVAMVTALENVNFVSDETMGRHVKRVSEYARFIAEGMGMEEGFAKRIGLYASLHDIGKVGVPREILISGLRYTPEEREGMKLHVDIGGRMLSLEGLDPMARNIARYHHEHWDGSGYLEGLSGSAIPLEARIVAVADTFDALTTDRPYKRSLGSAEAIAEIRSASGKAFDPAVVEGFLIRLPDIIESGGLELPAS